MSNCILIEGSTESIRILFLFQTELILNNFKLICEHFSIVFPSKLNFILAKVSERNSNLANLSHSEPIRITFWISFDANSLKITLTLSDSFQLNSRLQFKASIWIYPRTKWFRLIRIKNVVCINLSSDLFGFIGFKTFFGLVPNNSETDFGMARNSSDSLEFYSNPKLSPGT